MKWAPAILLLAACDWIDPMREQPKLDAYDESKFFTDGRAMRAPPAGTVPRRRPDEAPLPVDAALVMLGKERFEIYCAACHGVLGDGRSYVARNMGLRAPPSLHLHGGHEPAFYYDVVSRGFGLMPGYATQLSPRERWAVVAYLQVLLVSQRAKLEQAPPDVRRELLENKS